MSKCIVVMCLFQDSNSGLCYGLQNIKNDIAYLSDIFTKYNEINFQLQGNDVKATQIY